ncbi:hypothetical protein Tco_1112117 [Tanacetum coccineum]|uniref:Uncharacterized protein n=1 Tax=Tanacetum coccineum TaxID=301880 RepID=A0ABQ5INJ2_9ASTR
MKIQARIQVSRPRELTRQLQLGSAFWEDFINLSWYVFGYIISIVVICSSNVINDEFIRNRHPKTTSVWFLWLYSFFLRERYGCVKESSHILSALIDMSSSDDAQRIATLELLPFQPRKSFPYKGQYDDCREMPPCWRGRKSLVVVDWCDLKSISECIFSKVEPLLIQLTLVTPIGSVIANSILELLNIDSWYCRRGGKRSEEVGVFQNVHRNLVNWVALRFFSIQIAIAFPYWHPTNARQDLFIYAGGWCQSRPGVLDIVAVEGYGTLVVTIQRDAIVCKAIIR